MVKVKLLKYLRKKNPKVFKSVTKTSKMIYMGRRKMYYWYERAHLRCDLDDVLDAYLDNLEFESNEN